jgi:hypothetical protein
MLPVTQLINMVKKKSFALTNKEDTKQGGKYAYL